MVRAGKVQHPSEWQESGFNEIQRLPKHYRIIDRRRLCELIGVNEANQLRQEHARWIDNALIKKSHQRNVKWITSVAVGSHAFAESYMENAGSKVSYRKMKVSNGCTIIKELEVSYTGHL